MVPLRRNGSGAPGTGSAATAAADLVLRRRFRVPVVRPGDRGQRERGGTGAPPGGRPKGVPPANRPDPSRPQWTVSEVPRRRNPATAPRPAFIDGVIACDYAEWLAGGSSRFN
ncbi:hypothetical protein GCM10020366_24630 [Saccharopolyspora gregorii]|uniref:Uncharacterized protein n=1 Tax=Saccharopolyspora gregorii TaxID=33914 RepID=A0ABP6RUI2_9PSEU